MQVKKYEAPTLQEALETIKKEMGPDAIILQTKTFKKGFGLMSKPSVEVTVAIADKSLQKKKFVESRLPKNVREQVQKMPASKQSEITDDMIEKHLARQMRGVTDTVDLRKSAEQPRSAEPKRAPEARRSAEMTYAPAVSSAALSSPAKAASRPQGLPAERRYADIEDHPNTQQDVERLEDELRHLKRMLEEMKTLQDSDLMRNGAKSLVVKDGALSTLALQEMFELLVVAGIEKRFSYEILKAAQFELGDRCEKIEEVLEATASILVEQTRIDMTLASQKISGPRVVALIGPSGSGKTTTVGKLAALASQRNRQKVGLVHLSIGQNAAFDGLLTIAKLLNMPFRAASSAEDFRAALSDFQGLDFVVVDTPSLDCHNAEQVSEMIRLIKLVPDVRVELVLNATTRDMELNEFTKAARGFDPRGLMFTRLDEALSYGGIYNVSKKSGIPLTFFSTGKRVPEDFEEAVPERLASLILDI